MSTSKQEWEELVASLVRHPPEDADVTGATWRAFADRALEDGELCRLGDCLKHSLEHSREVAHLVAEMLEGTATDWKLTLKQTRHGRPRKGSMTQNDLAASLKHSSEAVHLVADILQGKSADWKPVLTWKHGGRPPKSTTAEKSIERAHAVIEAGKEIKKQDARVKGVEEKGGPKRRTVFKDLKAHRDLDPFAKEIQAARAKNNPPN